MKSVAIYNGSPRKKGNTVFAMQYVFEKLNAQPNIEVNIYNIIDFNIDVCYGCRKCMELKHCTNQTDEFGKLFNTVKASDITVWGVPVYWFSPPGITKNFIDRTHAYFACEPMLKNKYAFILNIASDSGFRNSETVMKSWLEWYGADVRESIDIIATKANDIKLNKSKIKQLDEFIFQILKDN